MEVNRIICGDCLEVMKDMPNNYIDLTVTSPPYDNLRDYEGYNFDFEKIAKELFRITKDGGVVVWVVGDATIKGSETGTSFKQALYFKEVGFNLHDTMIWNKGSFTAVGALKTRYAPVFEYMFVFSKGKIKTFNPLRDRKNISKDKRKHGTKRQKDGRTKPLSNIGKKYKEYGIRFNIWNVWPENSNNERTSHPAQMSIKLAKDHIRSWSNKGDLVLDPMAGSGTTCKAAKYLNRNYIGIEISPEYCKIAEERLAQDVLF